jgi:predicted flap endonuclease-1-like 5' DNA nuclease
MNWLSFFIGVLVGWIIEWLIDLFYWRRKCHACQEENEALQARLNEAERRIRTFQVKGWEREGEPERVPAAPVAAEGAAMVPPDADLGVDLEAPDIAVPSTEVDVELEAPEVDAPDLDVDAFFDGMRARFPDVDLEGSIERLKAKFPDLDLKTALHGLKFDFPDLDIDGTFQSMKARFPRLAADAAIGGAATDLGARRAEVPTVAPDRPDDLKRLEGIGPKISQLLKDQGIVTFGQLADTSVDRLEAILGAAGPRFRLADPATWPEQARLAADGAWDELQALQDRLIGGRKTGGPDG